MRGGSVMGYLSSVLSTPLFHCFVRRLTESYSTSRERVPEQHESLFPFCFVIIPACRASSYVLILRHYFFDLIVDLFFSPSPSTPATAPTSGDPNPLVFCTYRLPPSLLALLQNCLPFRLQYIAPRRPYTSFHSPRRITDLRRLFKCPSPPPPP